jgi:hypothetical protein
LGASGDQARRDQPTDQFSALAEAFLLWGFQLLVREFRLDLREQPRQRSGEASIQLLR